MCWRRFACCELAEPADRTTDRGDIFSLHSLRLLSDMIAANLFLAAAAAAMIGSVIVLGFLIRTAWRREQFLPWTPRQPVPWTSGDLALCALIWFFTQIAVLAFLSSAGYDLKPGADKLDTVSACAQLFAQIAGSAISAAAVLLLLTLRAGATPTDLGVDSDEIGRDLLLGLFGFLAALLPVYGLQAMLTRWQPSEHPLVVLLKNDSSFNLSALAVLTAVVMAPLVEELLFRVVLQGWFEKAETFLMARRHGVKPETVEAIDSDPVDQALFDALPDLPPESAAEASVPVEEVTHIAEPTPESVFQSPHVVDMPETAVPAKVLRSWLGLPQGWWPILGSALMFALMHLGNGPDPIPLFVFALVLGYLYQRTHRIWPSLVAHMLLNGSSLTMLFLERAGVLTQ